MSDNFSRQVEKTKQLFRHDNRPLNLPASSIPAKTDHLHPFTRRLYERLVIAAIDAVQDWDNWTEALSPGPKKNLQRGLVRAAKGVIKLWRTYLIETYQEERRPLQKKA